MSNEIKNELVVNEATGEVLSQEEAINLDMGEELAVISIKAETINKKDSKQSFKSFKASAQFMLYKAINEPSDLIKKYLYKSTDLAIDNEEMEQLEKDIEAYNSNDNFYLVNEEAVSIWVDCKFIQDIVISKNCSISNINNLRTGELACRVKDIDLPLVYKVKLFIDKNNDDTLKFKYPTCWIKAIEGFKPFYTANPNRFAYKKPKYQTTESVEETKE